MREGRGRICYLEYTLPQREGGTLGDNNHSLHWRINREDKRQRREREGQDYVAE
jgi:hypothetical protein